MRSIWHFSLSQHDCPGEKLPGCLPLGYPSQGVKFRVIGSSLVGRVVVRNGGVTCDRGTHATRFCPLGLMIGRDQNSGVLGSAAYGSSSVLSSRWAASLRLVDAKPAECFR